MEFTFGICTYNSESFILETLESIKYQIEKYGSGIDTYIVLSDDASSDKTIYFVEKWIELNKKIFFDIKIIRHNINRGISFNYCELLRNINTEYFIKIDGDDTFMYSNVFEKCFRGNKNDFLVYLPIMLSGDNIYHNDYDVANIFYYSKKKHDHIKDLHLMETIKPFITPEVVITKSNYTKECLDFLEEFSQFEDDTSLYYVLKNNINMRMSFLLEPLVLYRVHDRSLSNGGESIHQIHFLDDLHKFKKYMFKNEVHLGIKLFLFFALWDTFLMKHRFDASKCIHRKLRKKCEKKVLEYTEKSEEYSLFKKQIDEFISEEIRHRDNIKTVVRSFLSISGLHLESSE